MLFSDNNIFQENSSVHRKQIACKEQWLMQYVYYVNRNELVLHLFFNDRFPLSRPPVRYSFAPDSKYYESDLIEINIAHFHLTPYCRFFVSP